jgi:hypothetical protein
MIPVRLLALVDVVLGGLCLGLVVSGPATVLGAASSLVTPALVWETVGAFFLLFLSDIRAGSGLLLAWFSVVSITTLVLIYGLAVDPWAVLTLAVLTGRHLLARRAGQLESAFANLVRFVFAIFPAAWLAHLVCLILDLGFEPGVLVCGALYLGIRWMYRTLWDPHQGLGVKWSSRQAPCVAPYDPPAADDHEVVSPDSKPSAKISASLSTVTSTDPQPTASTSPWLRVPTL